VLSFFQVALGVSYPVGALLQGPVADRIGVGWTTACSAVALGLILAAVAVFRPGFARAVAGCAPSAPPAAAADQVAAPDQAMEQLASAADPAGC
jgi:predicted MFS family arabinose efflux permease